MRHDKRGDDGMYRCCTAAETRHARARELTQTHAGPFTHRRDEAERRMTVDAIRSYADWKPFKDQQVNRDAHRPKVTK